MIPRLKSGLLRSRVFFVRCVATPPNFVSSASSGRLPIPLHNSLSYQHTRYSTMPKIDSKQAAKDFLSFVNASPTRNSPCFRYVHHGIVV